MLFHQSYFICSFDHLNFPPLLKKDFSSKPASPKAASTPTSRIDNEGSFLPF